MRDPMDTPSREPPEEQPRRTFLKLAVLGGGAALAVTKLGCVNGSTNYGRMKPDVVSTGVLVARQRGGTVRSAASQGIYAFDVSATYKLSGQEIAFDSVRITGKPAAGGGSRAIVVSKKSDLRGTLNASGCFKIIGGANVSDGGGFASARIHLDGCVVSKAVPILRGTIVRPAGRQTEKAPVASAIISFS